MKILLWVFLAAAFFALVQEINTDDETWFLQVLHRFLSGEKLYKEIFLGVSPLSVYITALPMFFLGHELLIARLVLVLYFTLGVYFMLLIMKELKIERYGTPLFFLGCFVLAHPQTNWGFSPYNPLAKVLLLATFWTALKWNASLEESLPARPWIWLLFSACMAALCFAAKQNVGGIAALCALANCFVQRKKTGLFDMSIFIAMFFFVLALLFLPIFLQDAFDSFLHYGIFHKTRYLSMRDNTYFLDFKDWSLYSICIYLLPFALSLGGLLSFRKKGTHKHTFLIFLIGGALVLFPRPDNMQKIAFVPFALLGVLYFYSLLERQIPSRVQLFTKWSLVFAFSWVLLLPLKGTFTGLFEGELVFSSIPKLRWIVMPKACHSHWLRMKQEFSFARALCGCVSHGNRQPRDDLLKRHCMDIQNERRR